ncbi:hypothetical protein [Alicyclobacillus macrosporangiidus]|uniref:MazG nucleotide pyrophosphohydrolase domain-containing protein n=1 Tax=Alicyclobacillus macrosporangiidus TaxID=392015 RepID=A0A1I7L527_9BACL|nr:hypothetical protein [Alicyclobacillus macrosporangiidus]MCL6600641.1 hypothetical protein [Alicyclobacillus macrosporangiidus]SFV04745.1 hypothetical protein SAMN05421543_12510 [Alicyclobacillus macrosporangiidus]
MTRQEAFQKIHEERKRQDHLHPEWHGHQHGLVVLAEEFGEVAKALYEYHQDPTADRYEELKEELVQVAAVCVRWLEHLE